MPRIGNVPLGVFSVLLGYFALIQEILLSAQQHLGYPVRAMSVQSIRFFVVRIGQIPFTGSPTREVPTLTLLLVERGRDLFEVVNGLCSCQGPLHPLSCGKKQNDETDDDRNHHQ